MTTSKAHVIKKIGVPGVVTNDMEEAWISQRQLVCEENRKVVADNANLEIARFVEMTSKICGATFINYPGHPAKVVDGKKNLRKCWHGDGSPENCERLAWMLYYAPTYGHKRFREGRDWATWREECFIEGK
jgi:hypothetical protein